MTDLVFNSFAESCNNLQGQMRFEYEPLSPSVRFSNTGTRGLKFFSVPLPDLVLTFEDMLRRYDDFSAVNIYSEGRCRDLYNTLTSVTAKALAGTQTKPFFAILGKIIHVSNELEDDYSENVISFKREYLENTILYLKSQIPDNELYLDRLRKNAEPAGSGINIIYYGAPGVGKSYEIDQKCDALNSIRTVFHPDTQNSDFIGCLKPRMDGENVIYEFRAGPFTKAIVKAYLSPDTHVYLIVEEINRASAAAVFGEIFQLLDRDGKGRSVYPVDVIDPDMHGFLTVNSPNALVNGQLKIPSNLSIFATMNSSDQAVMPMDTAFKRRWLFEYVPIDFNSCPIGILSIPTSEEGVIEITWANFAQVINVILETNSIPEDRLLGPWFISPSELLSPETTHSSLKGKLFLYLWDDVLRHNQRNIIFHSEIKSFGQLVTSFTNGGCIFSNAIEQLIYENKVVPAADPVIGE
jgi:5-methylcytosine-specific restriction protein B